MTCAIRENMAAMGAAELAAFVPGLPGWPWPGETLSLHRIPSGLTNVNWRMRLERSGIDLFMKVPGLGTEAFIDRKVANQAAVSAAEAGVGPKVVYFDPESGIEVHEFLDGYSSSSMHSLKEPAAALEVMRLYRSFHQGPLLSTTKTL
ncbi:MAG: phosphotransferase family protein, partial [Bifidobacteriaceae bacterium]|nr:phosphotransferase family protein [Bifidobacteriaceae bacterium]